MAKTAAVLAFALLTITARINAQDVDEETAFVQSNILSIFYHELGHAVIDLMQVPIYGQEEDAADVMAVLFIHELYEEESAQNIVYDSAYGLINDPEQTEEVEYWDLHGPDEQRYYNHVCLFYGANVEEREEFAYDLGLPEERAESCQEEYEQAYDSWSVVFDDMVAETASESFNFSKGSGKHAIIVNQMLAEEIDYLNAEYELPQVVSVNVESCGESNAFYDPESVTITLCTEFVSHLESLYQASLDQ